MRPGNRVGLPGFSLVEVLVAVAVLAIGISAGVRTMGAMARSSAAAEERMTAIRLAGERLALLEAGIETEKSSSEGIFESEPRYRWQQQLNTGTEQGVVEATVTVLWNDGFAERHYSVTTYLLDTSQQSTAGAAE